MTQHTFKVNNNIPSISLNIYKFPSRISEYMEGYYFISIFISAISILVPVDIMFLKYDSLWYYLCHMNFFGLSSNYHAKTNPLFRSCTHCWQEILQCESAIMILLRYSSIPCTALTAVLDHKLVDRDFRYFLPILLLPLVNHPLRYTAPRK